MENKSLENKSLLEYPRSQNAPVIPRDKESSILGWLEGTGRLIQRDVKEPDTIGDEEEIAALMAGEDSNFEESDDDDDD